MISFDHYKFGDAIREYKISHKTTYTKMAKKCEITTPTFSRIVCSGFKPSVDTVARICAGLRLEFKDFIEREES